MKGRFFVYVVANTLGRLYQLGENELMYTRLEKNKSLPKYSQYREEWVDFLRARKREKKNCFLFMYKMMTSGSRSQCNWILIHTITLISKVKIREWCVT